MNNILKVLLISGSLIAVANSFAEETVYVNGKALDSAIVTRDLNRITRSSPEAAEKLKSNPQLKTEILKNIGTQEAIVEEAKATGLYNSPAVQAKIEEFKPMIYAQLMSQKVLAREITDSDLRAELKKHAAEYTEYTASHILVQEESTAKAIIAKLNKSKGTNFAQLAKQYSIDPGSKNEGGSLGTTTGANFAPAFTKALRSLRKGTYTKTPVQTQFGYHIIMVSDIIKPTIDKNKAMLTQEIKQGRLRDYFEQINTKYKVQVK